MTNAISQGTVETEALQHFEAARDGSVIPRVVSHTPAGRLVTPEDVAAVVTFLCSPDASMIRGQVIQVDGGFNLPLIPWREKTAGLRGIGTPQYESRINVPVASLRGQSLSPWGCVGLSTNYWQRRPVDGLVRCGMCCSAPLRRIASPVASTRTGRRIIETRLCTTGGEPRRPLGTQK